MLTFLDGYENTLEEALAEGAVTLEASVAPSALQGGPFYIVFGSLTHDDVFGEEDDTPSLDYEVVLVESGQNTTTWNIARGQFGTSDVSHNPNEKFKIYTGSGLLSLLSQAVASGETTLVAGTKAIANAAITANSIVKVWNVGPAGELGVLAPVVNAGVGFTINSYEPATALTVQALDTSKVYYEIVSY